MVSDYSTLEWQLYCPTPQSCVKNCHFVQRQPARIALRHSRAPSLRHLLGSVAGFNIRASGPCRIVELAQGRSKENDGHKKKEIDLIEKCKAKERKKKSIA